MKRILSILTAACLLTAPLFARTGIPDEPAFDYLYDGADVLTSAQEEAVRAWGEALREATGVTVVLLTVDFLDGMTAREYADGVLDAWDVGGDGAVLLLSVGDREVAVAPGAGLYRTLSADVTDGLIDGVIDLLAKDALGEGMTKLYQDTCGQIQRSMARETVRRVRAEKTALIHTLSFAAAVLFLL